MASGDELRLLAEGFSSLASKLVRAFSDIKGGRANRSPSGEDRLPVTNDFRSGYSQQQLHVGVWSFAMIARVGRDSGN